MWCYFGHIQTHIQFRTLDQHIIIQIHGCVPFDIYLMVWASNILHSQKKLRKKGIIDVGTNIE